MMLLIIVKDRHTSLICGVAAVGDTAAQPSNPSC